MVTGATDVKYSWTFNGTVVGASSTYEVPASAKDGDEIKVTVTSGDKTASDTVYVGGLTILYVEPTTAGAADYTGFKYIRATFSKALSELAPSQIEIRRKSDNQLYSVDSVALSADGTFADITLFGDSSAAGTFFLQAGPIYTMKVTQGSDVATLDFELPAYNTEAIVTSVDMSKNKITVTRSGKTQKPVTPGTYNVANKYDGNLGALVGRAVTFGYDSDSNMTSFTLLDQQVVYGGMKGFVPSGDENSWYYKDAITGEKYNCKDDDDATASIRGTLWIAADGENTSVIDDYADNTYFGYTKLVLNPDGTIATATIEKDLPNTLYVKDVDGTIVTQDENNAFDLDGYTIVEDGNYIATSYLVEGDVLFLNPTNKFAEVYVNAVSGEISDVIDGKLSIDGKAYTWYDAQYWDAANDKFVALAPNDHSTDAAVVAIQNSQNYLNTLDPEEDTTIYLNRKGEIAYLEGTPVEEVVTTTRELVVGIAKGYTQSLDNHIRIPAFDGTETENIDVVDTKLKTMFGDKGKVTFAPTANDTTGASTVAFEDKDDDAPKTDYDFTATNVGVATATATGGAVFPNTYLVDVVRNEAGTVTGFKPLNYTAAAAGGLTQPAAALAYSPVHIATIDGKAFDSATASDITSSTKKITTDEARAKTLSLGSYTNIWYHETQNDGTIKASKWALNEFPSAAVHDNADTYLVYSDGTKATDIVVIGTENTPTIKTGDTTSYSGIIVGNTKKTDSNGKNKINTIKMILTDGTTETFDVSEDAVIATWFDDGDGKVEIGTDADALAVTNNKYFATAVVNDNDDAVVQLTVTTSNADGSADTFNGWTDNTDTLAANRAKVSSKLHTANGVDLTVSNPAALLLKYTDEGAVKYKPVTYAEINTTETIVDVWYHTNYTDAADKIEADMIIVEDTFDDGTGTTVGTEVEVTTATELVAAAALADSDTTIIINSDVAATAAIDTPASIKVASGYTLALQGNTLDCADLTVNGTLTTKAAVTPTGNINVGTSGKIDILTATGSVTVAAGKVLTNKGTIKNAGTITNNGTVKNNGTITQNGTVAATATGLAKGTWEGTAPSDSALATVALAPSTAGLTATVTEETDGTPAAGDTIVVTGAVGTDQYGFALAANSTSVSAGTVTVTEGSAQTATLTAGYTVGTDGALTLTYTLGATAYVNANKLAVTIGTVTGAKTITATVTVTGGTTATTATAAIS